jgi:hypothetical protein
VRVGYAFGWIAAEGVALGSYDYSTASANFDGKLPMGNPYFGAQRTESYEFHRFGGGGALGVRVASKDPHVRLTASAMGGLATMGNIYKRTATLTPTPSTTPVPPNEYSSHVQTYVAALLLFDAGVLIGWANGAKLHASVVSMVQFVGDPLVAPQDSSSQLGSATLLTPALQVAQGTQVFVGPMLGFDLGL